MAKKRITTRKSSVKEHTHDTEIKKSNHSEEITILSEKLAEPEEDAFDFKKQSATVSNTIINNPPPFVYAICGKWGSGKSTFLKFMLEHFNKDSNNILIYFNAWKASIHHDARVAFVYEIEEQLRANKNIAKLIYTKSDGKKIGKEILFPLAVKYLFEKNTWTSLALDVYNKAVSQQSTSAMAAIKAEKQIIKEFQNISNKLSNKGYEVILIIDELDRCSPNIAIEILEAIRIFFLGEDELQKSIKNQNNKNSKIPFKYILTIDEDYLSKAFKEKYKLIEKDSYDYLAKFIQYRFHITTNRWTNFITNKINQINASAFFPQDQKEKEMCFNEMEMVFNSFDLSSAREARLILSYLFTWQKNNINLYNWINNLSIDNEIKEHEKTSIKNDLSRILNIYLVSFACIKVLYADELKWVLKRDLLKKFPKTNFFQSIIDQKNPWDPLGFLSKNFEVKESDIKTEGKIREQAEKIGYSLQTVLNKQSQTLKNIQRQSKINDLIMQFSLQLNSIII